MIEAGRVRVNGNTARLGEQADAEEDVIELDGARLKTRQEPELVYRMLCKPRGFVTTMHDEKGRRSVAELVRNLPVRVYPVGRLDCNSEGLLLLTNDGELANALMHPKKQVDKVYLVWVSGYIEGKEKSLCEPIEIDGRMTTPAQVSRLHADGGAALAGLSAREIGALAGRWAAFDRAENPSPEDGEERLEGLKKAWSTRPMSAFAGVCSNALARFRRRSGPNR